MNLRIYNEKVYNEYMKLDYEKMSCPLLVSTRKDYLENLKEPILYIGQETYTWLNHDNKFSYSLDIIEDKYYNFLKEGYFKMNTFWSFLTNSTGIPKEKFINRIIWGNCYICGKKYDKGITEYYRDIKDLSIDYLINLYKELNPKLTIFACGNREEYYSIIKEFIKQIKDYNIEKVNKENELIEIEDILYTYHPNNLRFSKNYNEIKQKIKSFI